MAKKLRRNLLLVCEGSVTEPDYFALLKQKSLEKGVWDAITIEPKPRSEQDDEPVKALPAHKSPRPRRQLKAVPVEEDVDETERRFNHRQTPVNFVKAARNGLKDNAFEEVWAVFDRDGHPGHEAAFQLAEERIEGKKVNIAFSSIAFEHWILLHFERNLTAFVKSECKSENGRYLNCGSDQHDGDCRGERCVAGRLRMNGYLEGSTKHFDESNRAFFKNLIEPTMFQMACINAAWLRNKIAHDPGKPFLTNPFTNVDDICRRLLGTDHETVEWANLGEPKIWRTLVLLLEIENDVLKCSISNEGRHSRLFNGTDISAFMLQNGEQIVLTPTSESSLLVSVDETKTFHFTGRPDWKSILLGFQTGSHYLFIDPAVE
ncbi:MAG TPA: RloB family protein [Saprospiraceae bacterium]|nr:RloB family protein [Saprospiraceae bacterium]